MFDAPLITNDMSIDRVLAAGLPVALVFLNGEATAEFERLMQQLARQYAGQLLVARVQIKDNPASASRFAVSATPAIVSIQGGNVKSKAGPISAADLEKHVLYLLGKGPKPEAPQSTQAGFAAQPGSSSSSKPLNVGDSTFEQDVLRSPLPVLVDFWAPWCGPCRMTEPIVEKLAHEMAGRAQIAKVNVDENPLTASRFGVQSIPTMMVVKNGQIVDRWVGALPEQALRSRIAPHF